MEDVYEYVANLTWRGANKEILVKDMTDSHLQNALNMLKGNRQNPNVTPEIRYAWMDALEVEMERRDINNEFEAVRRAHLDELKNDMRE